MMVEQQAVRLSGGVTEAGNAAILGLERTAHLGWEYGMTSSFAEQVAGEVLGYRLAASDEKYFADAARLATQEPPLSASSAGVLYAAIHTALNARAQNQGAEA